MESSRFQGFLDISQNLMVINWSSNHILTSSFGWVFFLKENLTLTYVIYWKFFLLKNKFHSKLKVMLGKYIHFLFICNFVLMLFCKIAFMDVYWANSDVAKAYSQSPVLFGKKTNFVSFCPNFQYLPFLNIFLPLFCPFSEKLHACPYFLE